MGSYIELNDTLQITTEQGFPATLLHLATHQKQPIQLSAVKDKTFHFRNKPKGRIYHLPPTRCFLVHNIDGKWLYWGKILIEEQRIHKDDSGNLVTSGAYTIIDLYEPNYQQMITQHESPEGKSYF